MKDTIGFGDGLQSEAKHERVMKALVTISAVITGALMIVFFMTVIQTTTLINRQVETVKEGPYPVSVAAGHIETNLVKIETIVEHLTGTQLAANQGASGGKPRYHFSDSINDIQEKLDLIQSCRLSRPEAIERLVSEFETLKTRLAVFTTMYWNTEPGSTESYDELVHYANEFIYPVLYSMLEINTGVIETTTNAVDSMYDSVNGAVSALFVTAVVLLVAVVVMVVIYMLLLRAKTRFENELRVSLEDALREAEAANEAKSMFLSNMSHDIRTPMNAIVGLTAIADENIDDKLRVKQCLTRISTSSQHLLSLINDVLDMNKIESGKVTLSEEVFSLTHLVGEIEMLIESQPQTHRLESSISLEQIDHDLLVGDTMRLKQILLNLTSNAIKYTNEGDRMEVVVRENPANQSTRSMRPGWADITFVVADTGIGMKREFVKRIFEPFERESNDFTIFTEGTGLGMSITKNLVDLMGGTIEVESELGLGTTVTISMPFQIASFRGLDADVVRAVEAEKEARPVGGARAQESKPVSGHAEAQGVRVDGRVLVVEDNDINMEIAQTLISSRGAEVEGAADGLEAVKAVSNAPEGYYDLVFMDWQMPHMNGIEATKAIRAYLNNHDMRQVPIVAMTANAFESDRTEALAAGMDDFMTKPINVHQMEDVLERYLRPAEEQTGEADDVAGVADDSDAAADAAGDSGAAADEAADSGAASGGSADAVPDGPSADPASEGGPAA